MRGAKNFTYLVSLFRVRNRIVEKCYLAPAARCHDNSMIVDVKLEATLSSFFALVYSDYE
ncbi:hypothetical protein BN439_1380 [Erwinia amylovora Ea644]|nr:hypothetical protein BN439_1380 [Erwinia amylovora Ea644]